ncbi:transmembrane amino acid transporter protein-domain-containing protein [Mycotypha africana]|uniref:transmembrane amino acid transporter protein-domain-containing protein n=1 Tax=Mycotypha africana TaxID=64632 RepID=UPI002300EBA7|nr:transmembrane amino acid transporter protein-domain-containing protein [Mycotypha africana]KAI8984355.1 transmembrane amino acid transporter protein-domain-containing protein [Mycotypha africana]
MPIQEVDTFYAASEKSYAESFKVEETAIDNYVEEDVQSENNVHYTRGEGSILTGIVSVTCVVAGTGTLGLPAAFATGGWLGILIMILGYIVACYSGIVLIRCLYYKPGYRLHDYKSIGRAAFGTFGYVAASFFHFLNLFGCPALYLVLAAGNMNYLLRDTSGALNTWQWTIIVGVIVLIPLLVCKTMKELTISSAIGAACTMIAVFIITVQGPIDRKHAVEPVINDGVIWTGFPSALATISFSYGGNNTYPHVEHALRKRGYWKYAVIAGLSICTCLYFLTAIPGYYSYGRDTQSPVYNSLRNETARMISVIVMTVHVLLAIPIFSASFSLEFEQWTKVSDERLGKIKAWFARALIRIGNMTVLVILAIFIPYFHDFMGLIGALCTCTLVFLLPVIFYLRLTGVRNKPWYELAFCAFTIFLGIIGCVFGTIDAIRALVADFRH